MTFRYALIAAASIATLAACSQQPARQPPPVSPAAKITGPVEDCIPLAQIRETRVRDDSPIDFMRDSRHGWRNTLPNRCSGLKMTDGFSYETSLSQLCSVDIVHVLERTPDLRRGIGCGLGKFVPIEIAKKN